MEKCDQYEINYDCINPQFAFKNKSTRENVIKHKALITQETPYIKQYNIDGDVDLINSSTGEVFDTQKQFQRKPKKEISATDFDFKEVF